MPKLSFTRALHAFPSLAGWFVIAFALSPPARAQSTITYSDTQVSTTDRTTTPENPLTFTIASGAATENGVVSGAGSVTKSGAGTLTFAATNTYTGTTRLEAGALSLGSASALGDTTGGDITFAGGILQYAASSITNYSARIKNSTGIIAIDTNGYNVSLGSLASSNTGGLTKSGAGTLTLSATNAYTGTTRLEAGTLRAVFGLGLGGSSSDTITFAGGTLQLEGSSDFSARIRNSTGAIAIDTSGPSLTFSNVLDSSNTGGLTKSGAGTLILVGDNAYSGGTTVDAGLLVINGSLADTAVTVANTATLGGRGTIGGRTTIASGGHIAPGNFSTGASSPGTLQFTNGLSLTAGAILDFQLGTASDLIRVSGGPLTGPSSGLVTLNLSDSGGFAAGIAYTLIDFAGADVTGFDTSDFTFSGTPTGYSYALAIVGSTLQLTASASAIPEPSTYAIVFGACAITFAAWRRRRLV